VGEELKSGVFSIRTKDRQTDWWDTIYTSSNSPIKYNVTNRNYLGKGNWELVLLVATLKKSIFVVSCVFGKLYLVVAEVNCV